MKIKEKIILSISILIVAFLLIFSNFQEPPVSQELVENKTSSNYSTLFFVYEILRYPSNVEIIKPKSINETVVLGFVTDPWNINFGIVTGNGSFVTRTIEMANLEEKDIKIILKSYGNISPLVAFSQNNIILKPKEKVSINIFLYSKNFDAGNYSGEVDIIAKKPIYNFLPIA